MDIQTVAAFAGVAAGFSGFIGCLIGYNIREKRHAADNAASRAAFDGERQKLQALINVYRIDADAYKALAEGLEDNLHEQAKEHTEVVAGLESQVDRAFSECERIQAELQPYADAMWEMAGKLGVKSHDSAFAQLHRITNHLLDCAANEASKMRVELTNPDGEFAKKVARKAKREHGKKLRAKYERQLQVALIKANGFENLHKMAEEELLDVQQQLLIRQAAFRTTCKDKLKLQGVRVAFKQAYWAEVTRLREAVKQREAIKDFVGEN